MSYTVTQNTFYLTAASILQKIVSFAYFTLIARVIGVQNTGQYFFAIAFTTIFAVVADFGFGPVLVRESSREPEKTQIFVSTAFFAKMLFSAAAYLLVILSANLLNYAPDLKLLIYISGLTMIFDSLQAVFYSVFRARRNLRYEAAGMLASQFITLVIGSAALLRGAPLVWLIIAYVIPSFLSVFYAAYFVSKRYGIRPKFAWHGSVFKYFFYAALPFAVAAILGRLYAYSDSVLMSKFLAPEHLGWWSVPYKITFAFQFIPAALAASVYPVFSATAGLNPLEASRLFAKAWWYLALIVLPLSFGLIAVGRPVILLLYGEAYLPSVPVLQILLISLIFGFLSVVTGSLLNATNRQATQTWIVALALVVNLVLNAFLLPRYGVLGAAWSALAGNFALWMAGVFVIHRAIILNWKSLASKLLRVAIPAALMGIMAFYLVKKASVLMVIPASAILYGILILLSGGLDLTNLEELYTKIFKRKDTIRSN